MGALAIAALAGAPDLTLSALVGPHEARAGRRAELGGRRRGRRPLHRRRGRRPIGRRRRPPDARLGGTTRQRRRHRHERALRRGPRRRAAAQGGPRILVVPNFSVGAVLSSGSPPQAAEHFDDVEVIELHHDEKHDAPSGTSIATAARDRGARRTAGRPDLVDRTELATLEGARGAIGAGGRAGPQRAPHGAARAPRGALRLAGRGARAAPRRPTTARASWRGCSCRCAGSTASTASRSASSACSTRERPRRAQTARERILEGTSRAICAAGVRQTSLEDIASESGCSRATVYRHFPGGRDELLEALVAFEHRRFFVRLGARRRGRHDARGGHGARAHGRAPRPRRARGPPDRAPRAARAARAHARPRGRPTLRLVADFLAPYLVAHGVDDAEVAASYADFLARMVLSYISSPGRWDLDDPAQVRRLVRCRAPRGPRAVAARRAAAERRSHRGASSSTRRCGAWRARGCAGPTVDDVASAAGVSRATLYRAFPGGRDTILAAVVDAECDRLFGAVAAAVAGAADLDAALAERPVGRGDVAERPRGRRAADVRGARGAAHPPRVRADGPDARRRRRGGRRPCSAAFLDREVAGARRGVGRPARGLVPALPVRRGRPHDPRGAVERLVGRTCCPGARRWPARRRAIGETVSTNCLIPANWRAREEGPMTTTEDRGPDAVQPRAARPRGRQRQLEIYSLIGHEEPEGDPRA